jgi:hypothetical protein
LNVPAFQKVAESANIRIHAAVAMAIIPKFPVIGTLKARL